MANQQGLHALLSSLDALTLVDALSHSVAFKILSSLLKSN